MGIFYVDKKDLTGKIIESYTMQNVILDAGLEYLCNAVGNDFNLNPQIGVGLNDTTPDINQIGLISSVLKKAATFTPGTATNLNRTGNKQFLISTHFNSNEAFGELTELAYYMNGIPLNRTLFQIPGTLDTELVATPELDQLQISDISNVNQVYGTIKLDQTFVVSATGGGTSVNNVSEIAISLASSGIPPSPFTVQLYDDNNGFPNTLLGTSLIPKFAEPVQRWRIAVFNPPISVTTGGIYHIVLSCPSTDHGNAYDVFGSGTDQYSFGTLSMSASGGGYTPLLPSQDIGFKTYYSTFDNVNHNYAITSTQFNSETSQSPDFHITTFPENNLDSNSTNQGTVRLSLATSYELPEFTSAIKIYKKVVGIGNLPTSYNLLATVGTVREYFYDNGLVIPDATQHPPSIPPIVTTPTGLTVLTDTINGGILPLGQNKFYKVSAILQGPTTSYITVGPYPHPGIYVPPLGQGQTPPTYFYDVPYSTIATPLFGTEYETAASPEFTLTAPVSASAQFTEYFTTPTLDPTKWNMTNDNADYFSVVKLGTTGETQLQMNVPPGVGFVISSTRQARPGQSYYINVQIPLVNTVIPYWVRDSSGHQYVNPILTDSVPNRVSIFSFINPTTVQTQNNDKRLSLEYGFYRDFLLDAMTHTYPYAYNPENFSNPQGSINDVARPYFALYDNVGNVYLFSTTDIPQSHSDKSYTFRIDILADHSMQINVLNGTTRSFHVITSTVYGDFSFKNQFNKSHNPHDARTPYPEQSDNLPGPLFQTTNHFLVPETYSFSIGNPSNDWQAYAQVNYIACNDSIYTIPNLFPSIPVPAIAMTVNGSTSATQSGFGATITWNNVPGARKYRLYATQNSGNYTSPSGNLVFDYETYFPAYAVQSTDTPNNDFQNGLIAVGNQVRNWQDIGVTYGVDATSYGNRFGSYALGGFVGNNSINWGNPLVPSISSSPGTAETFLLLLNNPLANEMVMFTFMGGGVEIVGETGPDRGIGSVFIDGFYSQDVDFYSSSRKEQQSVFRTDVLTPGYHTIMIHSNVMPNDYSIGMSIALDYFHITVPAIVDSNNLFAGAPSPTNDTNIVSLAPPPIKFAKTYNGNGPTIVIKDPQHTLDVELIFNLINPNL